MVSIIDSVLKKIDSSLLSEWQKNDSPPSRRIKDYLKKVL